MNEQPVTAATDEEIARWRVDLARVVAGDVPRHSVGMTAWLPRLFARIDRDKRTLTEEAPCGHLLCFTIPNHKLGHDVCQICHYRDTEVNAVTAEQRAIIQRLTALLTKHGIDPREGEPPAIITNGGRG